MVVTKTSISNQALSYVGAKPISDFTTDNSNEAIVCRLHFDDTVNELLNDYPWKFATKRTTLSSILVEAPTFGYTNAFMLPADFVMMVETSPEDAHWTLEENKILTDEASIGIVYIYSLTDTSKYKPKFVSGLALLLASKLAMALTRDMKISESLYSRYVGVISVGQSHDSQQQSRQVETLDTLTIVRF